MKPTDKAKKQIKTQMQVRIPANLLAWCKRQAKQKDISLSKWVKWELQGLREAEKVG